MAVMPESSPTYKMHRRSRVRIGFCVSFPVGSVVALGSMISTQAIPGADVVFLYLAVGWFVLYAACGALPYLAAGTEKQMVAAAFWGFGIGGAAAMGAELSASCQANPERAHSSSPLIENRNRWRNWSY
jgi:hypothetical protein